MSGKVIGIVKQLGWIGFFKLLTHLPSFLKLFSRLVKDPRVALSPKLLLAATLAYVIILIDIFTDFLPGVDLDDLAVMLAGLKFFLRLCPPEVVQEHLRAISEGR